MSQQSARGVPQLHMGLKHSRDGILPPLDATGSRPLPVFTCRNAVAMVVPFLACLLIIFSTGGQHSMAQDTPYKSVRTFTPEGAVGEVRIYNEGLGRGVAMSADGSVVVM